MSAEPYHQLAMRLGYRPHRLLFGRAAMTPPLTSDRSGDGLHPVANSNLYLQGISLPANMFFQPQVNAL